MSLQAILEQLALQKSLIEGKFNPVESAIKELTTSTLGMDARIKMMEDLFRTRKSSGVSLPGVNEGKQQFSFLKAIRAIRWSDWKDAGFEKEVFDETRKRAMSQTTDSAGGYLVPTQHIAELIEMLYDRAVCIALGATVLDNLTGSPVEIPKQTGGATAYWPGENAAITDSNLTLDQLSLSPKAVGCLVKLSNRLIQLSNPSAEVMVRRDIATALALAIDLKALRGDGTSNTPTGIANTSGINTVAIGTSGGVFDFDIAMQMIDELDVDNALKGKLGFAFHSKVKGKMKRERVPQFSGDGKGAYVMMPMTDAVLKERLGYAFETSNQIPTNLSKGSGTSLSEVYFGNWEELLIGSWGAMQIMASQETSDAFEKNQTWVRILQDVDIGVRHAQSFCLCSDANSVFT